MESTGHSSAHSLTAALKKIIRQQIHALLHPNGEDTPSKDTPLHHRLEWFQNLDHVEYPVGKVKFELVVGYNPFAEKKFSAHVGYTVVAPARVPEARGCYQTFHPKQGRFRNNGLSEVMVKPTQVLQAASVPIHAIEQAIARTQALAIQPYAQAAYDPTHLEEMLGHLHEEASGLTVVSANFSNPLHPDLAYCFVGTGSHDKVVLHHVGFPKQGTPTDIRDIRTYRGCIGDIVDAVHDSLAHSYVCPTEFTTACRTPKVESLSYFR